jgi:cyclophilin family peptidyl-prolyl cis-trans isomerase
MKRLLVVLSLLMSAFTTSPPPLKTHVIMHTEFGDVHLHLYDDAPRHKENFLKLCRSGYYDGMAFHRVIPKFMVQTGEPRTKLNEKTDKVDVDYTIPAEIRPNHWHKKGTLAAARESDEINPDWKSSGGQFYVVTGRTFTQGKLDTLEMRVMKGWREKWKAEFDRENAKATFKKSYDKAHAANQLDAIKALDKIYNAKLDEYIKTKRYEPFHFNAEQRSDYTTIGGSPWLDTQYTIFGEVTQGIEIVEQINAVETDSTDTPIKPVRILKMEVLR